MGFFLLASRLCLKFELKAPKEALIPLANKQNNFNITDNDLTHFSVSVK